MWAASPTRWRCLRALGRHCLRLAVPITLHTHFLVRDDAQQLYGFASRLERDLFRALMRIPGVGPKLALAVISTFDPQELAAAAAAGDVARLTRIPGVGRKTRRGGC